VILSGGVALVWSLSQYMSQSGDYWFGLQPIFPGLGVSLAIFLFRSRQVQPDLPERV
jgi:hypothetical protein